MQEVRKGTSRRHHVRGDEDWHRLRTEKRCVPLLQAADLCSYRHGIRKYLPTYRTLCRRHQHRQGSRRDNDIMSVLPEFVYRNQSRQTLRLVIGYGIRN